MAVLLCTPPADAQNIGHKIPGSIGMFAGSQPDSGIYVIDVFALYNASQLFDRNGHRIPIALDLDAWTNLVGLQVTFKLPWDSMYMNVAAAFPYSHVSLQTDQPLASVDELGLGDIFVQPVKIGWKKKQGDIVAGYSFYVPTGLYIASASGSIGLGQWTHEFSLGGTLYFDPERTWNVSVLTSYDLNERKEGIDITRGDTVQFQGGAGKTFRRAGKAIPRVDLGLAGYGLWQVRADRGAALPAALSGQRDLVFGVGPEIGATLAPIRSRITVRYCRDVDVKSRPLGRLLVIQLTITARRN